MADASTPRCVLLGRSGFFAPALAKHLAPRVGARLRVVGSAEIDLTMDGSADRLAELIDHETILIVPARAPRGSDPLITFAADIAIATNIARAVLSARPLRCVYFSSTAVYGDATTNLAITEDAPLAPNSLYAHAKVAAEGALRHAAERAGVPLLILRPCMVYGPGDTARPYGPGGFLHSAVREGKVRVFGDGSELRDYLFVSDLAEIAIALALGGASGVLNLASGTSHSFQQVLEAVRAVAGHPIEVVNTPRERPRTDQRFDLTRLHAALPSLRFTPLDVGLTRTRAVVSAAPERS
jgi:UDP-glucose 4-epimerase